MGRLVEVGRAQHRRCGRDGVLGQHHRPEQVLLGHEVTRRDPPGTTRPRPAAVATGRSLAPRGGFGAGGGVGQRGRSEEHTSELQSLMRISYAVFCLKKKKKLNKIYKMKQYTKIQT